MKIQTPSRLHITLIDLNGSYGRIDGGIGLTLADPHFILEAVPADKEITIEFTETAGGSPAERSACRGKVTAAAEKAAARYAPGTGYHFTVHQFYPAHSGLGSGTQMSLAAAKLIAELSGHHPASTELAGLVGRGGTSGIGVHAFDLGGFIADGGHSKKEKSSFMPSSVSTAKPACLLGRYPFPEDWGVLLAVPAFGNRYNGAAETNIFQTHCPVPKTDVEQVSHLVFMNLIPFLIEHDIEAFGHALDQIQAVGFNKIEMTLQPPELTDLMHNMRDAGAYGVGLSSFGPTLFTVYDRANRDIVDATKELLGENGRVIATRGQNHGAELF
ncbi:MAG: beta-ribofuranosylaminobenzene 5'-phosphate synthase [Methanocorpusculum sp.]|nr:beta-ribofuranosylaminobenzene 5'-phosphate synthase [Methanocorpusculum sp.]